MSQTQRNRRLQAEDAIDAAIVGLSGARRLQSPRSALHHVAKRTNRRAGDAFAVLVEDRPGDDAAANDLQLHLQTLTVSELNGRARPSRLALTIRATDVPRLRRRQVVATFGQRAEGETSHIVGGRSPAAADLAAPGERHARAACRLAAAHDDDCSGNDGLADGDLRTGLPGIARWQWLLRARFAGRALRRDQPRWSGKACSDTAEREHQRQGRRRKPSSHSCPVRRIAHGCRLVDPRSWLNLPCRACYDGSW